MEGKSCSLCKYLFTRERKKKPIFGVNQNMIKHTLTLYLGSCNYSKIYNKNKIEQLMQIIHNPVYHQPINGPYF